MYGHPMDLSNPYDLDRMLLCNKHSQIVTWYTMMKAYGNHFRIENSKNNLLQIYNSIIVLMFDMPTLDVTYKIFSFFVR